MIQLGCASQSALIYTRAGAARRLDLTISHPEEKFLQPHLVETYLVNCLQLNQNAEQSIVCAHNVSKHQSPV